MTKLAWAAALGSFVAFLIALQIGPSCGRNVGFAIALPFLVSCGWLSYQYEAKRIHDRGRDDRSAS